MRAPVFLTPSQVANLQHIALEQFGGKTGLRDRAAFESAVAHPEITWLYEQCDLYTIAATYAFHLAEAQSFIDGNKRTGMAAAFVFLRLNGITIHKDTDVLHHAMISISSGEMSKAGLADLFRKLATNE